MIGTSNKNRYQPVDRTMPPLSLNQAAKEGFFDQKNGLFYDTPGALAVSGL
jgi:hypothetical protein